MAVARRKKSKKASSGEAAKKVHKKAPGFDAFCKTKVPQVKRRKGKKLKLVECEDIAEPETGIHVRHPLSHFLIVMYPVFITVTTSLEWAKAIVPQPASGFLKMPFEVRLKIYELAVEDFTFTTPTTPIEPKKKGKKFWSPGWINAAEDTERLYMICRQSYVDVVGSGLIYRLKPFTFSSPAMMLNYLLVIHPVHRDAIRSISLTTKLSRSIKNIQPLALSTLASLPNLQTLNLKLLLGYNLCDRILVGNRRHFAFTVRTDILEHIKTSAGLVGDGKTNEQGGKGGIRNLSELNLEIYGPYDRFGYYSTPSNHLLIEGDLEKFQKLEQELRSIMVKS
ncbi:hypothetical protein EG329_014416 [Mollisiaceae sp. DMI_Dod_QoI]|nr:hypothetical protein EG329_014416 [Helotiales sp. DMI_Dod_QoI]